MSKIRFSNPRKQKMASGNKSFELREEDAREVFPRFSKKYAEHSGCATFGCSARAQGVWWPEEYNE